MTVAFRFVLACMLSLLVHSEARAEQKVATLVLDGLSFLSFEGFENLPIPAGSKVRFRFNGTGGSFTIGTTDVEIPPIELGGGRGKLTYTLAEPATGQFRQGEDGLSVSFSAAISVSMATSEGSTSHVYPLTFTTNQTDAKGVSSGSYVSIEGMDVVPGAHYVQLVGAVSNDSRAAQHPGRAVYTVLSGTFDWMPSLD